MVQSTAVQTSNPMSAPPQLSLIPNPGKGIFALEGHMQSDHSDDIWIDVLDMVGKVVYHDKITLTHEKIDKQVRLPATIPDGVYIIKVHTDMNNLSIRYSLIR